MTTEASEMATPVSTPPPPEIPLPPAVPPLESGGIETADKAVQTDEVPPDETLENEKAPLQLELSEVLAGADDSIKQAIKEGWQFEDLPEQAKEAGQNVADAMLANQQAKEKIYGTEWNPETGEGKFVKDGKPIPVTQRLENVRDVLKRVAESDKASEEVKTAAGEQAKAIDEHLERVEDFANFTETFEVSPEDKPKLKTLLEEVYRGQKAPAQAREEAQTFKLGDTPAEELANARQAQSPEDERITPLQQRINRLLDIKGRELNNEQVWKLVNAQSPEDIEEVLRTTRIEKGKGIKKIKWMELLMILFFATDAMAKTTAEHTS